METQPQAIVETEIGYETVIKRTGCVPVPVAAKIEGVSNEAIYARCNRGTQSWFSVYGQPWVVPRTVGQRPTTPSRSS